MKQLLNAMKYLEGVKVVHRDLKLENILVNSKMELKITDFGFSTTSENLLTAYGGTASYMAPEVVERKKYDG